MEDKRKKQHPRAVWLFFLWSLAPSLVVSIPLGFVILPTIINGQESSENFVFKLTATGIAVVALAVLVAYVWAKLTYRFYFYELRPEAFRKEHGIIWKRYTSIPYERIQNVDIYRGLIARLLGLSDINIQTAGMSAPAAGPYGAGSEGRLPGLARVEAEAIRDELIARAKGAKNHQGL